jgi:hypothetical protein
MIPTARGIQRCAAGRFAYIALSRHHSCFCIGSMSDSYDIYLVLHPLRDSVPEFQVLLRPLEPLGGDYLLGVDGYYNPETDTALMALRFAQQTVDRLGSLALHLYTSRSGLPMVIPARLSATARRRFFIEHLSEYCIYLQQYPAAGEDMSLIARSVNALVNHIEPLPRPAVMRAFDPSSDLPLFNAHSPAQSRRLDSAG